MESASLDVRGVFVLHAPERIYLWVGHECKDVHGYLEAARTLIRRLQTYERAPSEVVTLYSDRAIPFQPDWHPDGARLLFARCFAHE